MTAGPESPALAARRGKLILLLGAALIWIIRDPLLPLGIFRTRGQRR